MRKTKQLVTLCASAVVVIIVGLAIVGLIFAGNDEHDAGEAVGMSASSSHSTANKSAKAGTGSGSAAASSNTKNAPSLVTPGAPTTTVLKTTTNSDGTTMKEIVSRVPVPFTVQTQNDGNLKRGTTQVQAGQNGTETIIYSVMYDQNGKEISRKTISDMIINQPVNQITKIGTSDFNLNTDTWDAFEFGEMCLPGDYNPDPAVDGCVGVPSDRQFSAVEISGVVDGTCRPDTVVNVQPVIAVQGNAFSYQGTTYRADPRAGAGESQPLTPAICSQYGLACGSW